MSEPMIDAAQVVREVMPQIHGALVERVTRSLVDDVYAEARQQIAAELKPFIDEHVMPAMREALQEAREGVVAAIVAEIGNVGPRLAEYLAKKTAETLADNYRTKKLFETLLGSY